MNKLDKATLIELIEKVREYWSGNKTTDEAKALLNEACAVSEASAAESSNGATSVYPVNSWILRVEA